MTPLLVFVYTLIVCSLSFMFGTWWCSVGQMNKDIDKKSIQKSRKYVCYRCGDHFYPDDTDDPQLTLCPVCMEVLKNKPGDPYWDKEA